MVLPKPVGLWKLFGIGFLGAWFHKIHFGVLWETLSYAFPTAHLIYTTKLDTQVLVPEHWILNLATQGLSPLVPATQSTGTFRYENKTSVLS